MTSRSTPGICPKEMKTYVYTKMRMFIAAAFFTTVLNWTQMSINMWIDKRSVMLLRTTKGRMLMPVTMRTKLKVWQKRQTQNSTHRVIDVQRSPENADAWWRRQRRGELLEGPRSPGMGTFSTWTGSGLPQYIHQSGHSNHTLSTGVSCFRVTLTLLSWLFKWILKHTKK